MNWYTKKHSMSQNDFVTEKWLDAHFKKEGPVWMSSASGYRVWVTISDQGLWKGGFSDGHGNDSVMFHQAPLSKVQLARVVSVAHPGTQLPLDYMRNGIEAWGVNIPMLQMSLGQLRSSLHEKASRTPPRDFNPAEDLYHKNLARFLDALAGCVEYPSVHTVTGYDDDAVSERPG